MGNDADDLVILRACNNQFEASTLRAALEGTGIFTYLQGENHRGMLGAFGTYIAVNVMVRKQDAPRAAQLLLDFDSEEADSVATTGDASPHDEDPAGDDEDPFGDDPDESTRAAPLAATAPSPGGDRPGVAALLSLTLTFGSGNFYARSRGVGAALAVMEVVGLFLLYGAPVLGALLIGLAVVTDLITAPPKAWGRARRRQKEEG